MKTVYTFFITLSLIFISQSCTDQGGARTTAATGHAPLSAEQTRRLNRNTLQDTLAKSDEEWKEVLTSMEYYVLREKGTERAFSGEYNKNKQPGIYACAACGQVLFSSETKFESGTGWPSFYRPVKPAAVLEETDNTFGMRRTEVMCSRCGGHLGHVFDDGPGPTGLRYCLNSVALGFIAKK